MKTRIIAGIVVAVVLAFGFASTAQAFECPPRFKDAKAAIAKATAAMMPFMKKQAHSQNMGLIHTLIDDAKMLLTSGIHNHEKPQGIYDHARAVAKGKAAEGYANAAEVMARAVLK